MMRPLELTVMMYHYIRDPGDSAEAGSGIPGMPVRAFEAQLDELASRHTFVSWRDVRRAVQGEGSLPAAACLLTFDDGLCDHYVNVHPILRRRGLSGLFFVLDRSEREDLVLGHRIHFLLAGLGVDALRDAIWSQLDDHEREQFIRAEASYREKYGGDSAQDRIDLLKAVLQREFSARIGPRLTDLFERHIGSEREIARTYYLTGEQIQEMSAGGMHFGGHSQSHPWFDWIDARARQAEIQASARWIRQIEQGPWAFAYPYGGLADDAPGLLHAHGFAAAFTTQGRLKHADPYLIGRLDGEEIMSGDGSYV